MTAVKICGITRMEDALLAAELGAAAVGIVCWPGSPRFLDASRAVAIARALPPLVVRVGVFVNQPLHEVNETASLIGLDAVQLHGDEDGAYARAIQRRVIKAMALREAETSADSWPGDITLLVDAVDGDRRGGTGRQVDWQAAAALAARRPIILAGGLCPENVGAAIRSVHPLAVDVASGVETAGIKHHGRLREFFLAVRAASGEER